MSYVLIVLTVFLLLMIVVSVLPVVFGPHLQKKALARPVLSAAAVDAVFDKAMNANRRQRDLEEARWKILVGTTAGVVALSAGALVINLVTAGNPAFPVEFGYWIPLVIVRLAACAFIVVAASIIGGPTLLGSISSLWLATLKDVEAEAAWKRFNVHGSSVGTGQFDQSADDEGKRLKIRTAQTDRRLLQTLGVLVATGVTVGAVGGWVLTRKGR